MERSIPDDELITRTNQEAAILLTADKDFGELMFRQRMAVLGVILVRLHGSSPSNKGERVAREINAHMSELTGHFTVITRKIVRIRKHPL